MDRTLAPDVFDLLTQPGLPPPVRAAAERIDASAPIEVDETTAQQVMAPLLWMTQRVGADGLALTKAGHLRPVDVTALMTELGWDSWWIGKNNREELTAPAGMLRRAAVAAKLVRKYKGTLRLTRAGRNLADDPVLMWFHVAEQLPVERHQGDRIAAVLGILDALTIAQQDQSQGAIAPSVRFDPAEALTHLGWFGSDGTPLEPYEFRFVWEKTGNVLNSIGVGSYGRHARSQQDRIAFLRSALTRPVPDNAELLTRPKPKPRRRSRRCHTITIALDDITPTVWRQILVPSTITLLQLHNAIQSAMGWTMSHLFALEIGEKRYGYPDPDFGLTIDAATQTLDQALPNVGDHARYEYDFGDGWAHTLTVDAIETADNAPTVLAGANACPPEDCGGWPGYEDLLDAQSDPTHERHREIREWLGYTFDPTEFNQATADAAIKQQRLTR